MTGSAVPDSALVVAGALLGLLVGSFLNVVIHRVPAGLSLVSPGSACPACGHPVRGYDNVPVLSWLALRGRCRDCHTPISRRYPLVELATSALFAATTWRFGLSVLTGAALALVAAGVALFMIDLDHRRLPFSVTGTAAAALVMLLGVEIVAHGSGPLPTAVLSALFWMLVYGGAWVVTSGRGMGLGDVALAPVLGLALGWIGWGASLVGLMGGFVIGSVLGVVLLATGRAQARSRVPHGPFLLSGALFGMFAGQALWKGYMGLFGLAP